MTELLKFTSFAVTIWIPSITHAISRLGELGSYTKWLLLWTMTANTVISVRPTITCFARASGVPVAKWSDGMAFLLFVWELYLEPNETYTHTLNWNFYLYNPSTGIRYPPEPGKYELVGVCVGHFLETSPAVVTSKLPFEIF